MASSSVSAPVSGRIGKRDGENVGMVEIDAVFGRMLGLSDGQKVGKLNFIVSISLIFARSIYYFI